MAFDAQIVVLGAGVVGLTTALQLAKQGYSNVSVVAKHMPGDNHPEYTSIWAGVNWVPVSKEGTEEAQWDIEAYHELKKLADSVPAAGVWLQVSLDKTTYYRNEDLTRENLDIWFRTFVTDFKVLSRSEVPDFADWGTFYRTIALDPSIYLHHLQVQCLSRGVEFRRGTLGHIREAFLAGPGDKPADVVVNCTGLWASKLRGVEDVNVVPMRGQLVIVENESNGMFSLSGDPYMNDDVGECCYVIDRPSGGGTALGGSYYHDWGTEPDLELSQRILERSVKVCPGLVPAGAGPEKLRVIRHQVGLRPLRHGGPRIERETVRDDSLGKLSIVHCYGMGGFGFQSSYGVASKTARLVGESLAVKSSL